MQHNNHISLISIRRMTNLTIVLLFLLFSINVQCEPEFKIQITRAIISKQNTDYVNASVWLSKISRYINGLNAVIDLHRDVPHEAKVKVKFYEFLHNEYRPFAINLERDLCSLLAIEYKSFIYPGFVKAGGHMPEPKCPVRKGIYSLANYTVDETILPPALPFNNAMLEVGFWYQNKATIIAQIYVTFDRDVIIREKYT